MPAATGLGLAQSRAHLPCINDTMAIAMIPMERKCLTDGLVVPSAGDAASGALVVVVMIEELFKTTAMSATAVIVTLMPAALALV